VRSAGAAEGARRNTRIRFAAKQELWSPGFEESRSSPTFATNMIKLILLLKFAEKPINLRQIT
jgi:hypothetical protein